MVRGGVGVVYNVTTVPGSNPLSYQFGDTPAFGQAQNFTLADGVPSSFNPMLPEPESPELSPALPGTVSASPGLHRPEPGSVPRGSISGPSGSNGRSIATWSSKPPTLANRGVWWSAGALAPVNVLSAADLTRFGFADWQHSPDAST